VEELTTLVVVEMAILQVLGPTAVPVAESVQTVARSTQVVTVVTEVVDPLTSTAVEAMGMDLTIPMVITQQE